MNSIKRWSSQMCTGAILAVALLPAAALGGTFGKVVAIGGHASDLALDEARGVLYIANFTANRIEVMSLSDSSIRTSFNVAPQPGSLALSADGRYLVVVHFSNFTAPNTPSNALTVIDLDSNARQTFAMGNPPLGVAFGIDNRALIVTTADFLLFDPVTGATQVIDTIAGVTAKTLPTPPANFPANIVASSVAASADGLTIVGVVANGANNQNTIEFNYDVTNRRLRSYYVVSSPPAGPRAISVARNGNYYISGWAMYDLQYSALTAQFPDPTGILNIGSHAIDSTRGLVYAQVISAPPGSSASGTGSTTGSTGSTTTTPPVLQVADAENLAVLERLQLAENLAGKSLMNSDDSVMYSISDSGVTVLPVGALAQQRRLIASQEDIVFRGNFCERRVGTQTFTLTDPSGQSTDFSLSASATGVTVTPSSGSTPATITVYIDPTAFQNQKGTSTIQIQVKSSRAINLPPPVRVLVNNMEPDQRGSFVNIPGKLVDTLPDPFRDRFYVLRQDRNQVLVFDGTSYSQIATLKTGNTPTQMAISFDRRYLMVGHDNSQIITVYDLETLEKQIPIRMPFGHYPRSIAASGNAILVANRVAGPFHTIDRVDMRSRTAQALPSLGVYENKIHINTVLTSSANGSSILAASADGTLMLYNANVDTFTISRKDSAALSGAYAASSFDQFVVGNALLNSSLVPVMQLETASGQSSGFAFVDQFGFRATAPNAASPGVIQRVNLQSGQGIRPTRMVEAPVIGDQSAAFTRTLAPLYSRSSIVALTTSGITVLPWTYDTSVAPPRIERVVNAADQTLNMAPGGLISLFGRDLSPVNIATRQIPLPTALGESCLTVNGVPVPMLFVSSSQMNAQMPFAVEGNVTMILRTPGGVSDNFNLTVLPAAPSVFRSGVAGPQTDVPTVIRSRNSELVTVSNPVHRGDTLVIYLTGLGRTTPAVEDGMPAPSENLSSALIPPTVRIGGIALPVDFAGLTPGEVGVYQINVAVPHTVPLGMQQELQITQGGSATSLPVRVVD